jgi:hypothetical protein
MGLKQSWNNFKTGCEIGFDESVKTAGKGA